MVQATCDGVCRAVERMMVNVNAVEKGSGRNVCSSRRRQYCGDQESKVLLVKGQQFSKGRNYPFDWGGGELNCP